MKILRLAWSAGPYWTAGGPQQSATMKGNEMDVPAVTVAARDMLAKVRRETG